MSVQTLLVSHNSPHWYSLELYFTHATMFVKVQW